MKKIREILNIKRPSLFYLSMPILIDYNLGFINNENPPYFKLSILFVVFILFNCIYLKLYSIIKKMPIIFALIHSFLFLFYYYTYVLYFLNMINNNTINLDLRAKYILPAVLFFISYFIYIFRNKLNNIMYVTNVFFIILCFVKIIDNIDLENINKVNVKSYPISLNRIKGNPVLLIIVDEYASPCELIKIYKDSSIFDFKKNLLKNNWIAKNNMFSADTLTINSLASLFNFNFQLNDQFLSIPLSKKRLRTSTLYDSLEKRKIKFYNYGIFDIGKSKAMTKVAFNYKEYSNNDFILNCYVLMQFEGSREMKLSLDKELKDYDEWNVLFKDSNEEYVPFFLKKIDSNQHYESLFGKKSIRFGQLYFCKFNLKNNFKADIDYFLKFYQLGKSVELKVKIN